MFRTHWIAPLFTVAFFLAATDSAIAQYPYNPYGPYGYGSPAMGPGNTLSGAAQVIQASGGLYIDQEKARIEREKYYQEKLNTKRQTFDEAAYEKANTPTFTEDQEKILTMKIRRMMNQPMQAEIARGDTLNTLLPYVKALTDTGSPGPPTSLNQNALKSINVAEGTGGAGSTGPGMLKNGGRVSWPLALRGPLQKKLDVLLPEAVKATAAGTLEPELYTQISSTVQSMQSQLTMRYRKEQIDSGTYLTGKHFADNLASSLKVLQQPDAAKFFDGSYTAQGQNVPELVANMTAQGMRFAPATPGAESAYFSLHNAFVTYARAAQSGSGFQPTMAHSPQRTFK